MTFERQGKTIFGVHLNKKEEEFLYNQIHEKVEAEVVKEQSHLIDRFEKDVDCQVLWFLHKALGFGKQRLLKAFEDFQPYMDELSDYYELPESDAGFIAKQKLKQIGVDIDELLEVEE